MHQLCMLMKHYDTWVKTVPVHHPLHLETCQIKTTLKCILEACTDHSPNRECHSLSGWNSFIHDGPSRGKIRHQIFSEPGQCPLSNLRLALCRLRFQRKWQKRCLQLGHAKEIWIVLAQNFSGFCLPPSPHFPFGQSLGLVQQVTGRQSGQYSISHLQPGAKLSVQYGKTQSTVSKTPRKSQSPVAKRSARGNCIGI
jgi:hypothetical protein